MTARRNNAVAGFLKHSLAIGLSLIALGALNPAQAKSSHHAAHHLASRHTGSSHQFARATRHGDHERFAETRRHGALAERNTHTRFARQDRTRRSTRYATEYQHSWLQCVPYAREVSHIDLSGDAFLWWAEAAGRYARGNTPVEGAVLNFRSIRRMPLGHVAVVTAVVDDRTVLVTQANWVRGTITNDVTIEDVSPDNDWSLVQVELGDGDRLGAAYPTYGFIYNQPADSTVIASTGAQAEVAEAPKPAQLGTDAPDRNLQ